MKKLFFALLAGTMILTTSVSSYNDANYSYNSKHGKHDAEKDWKTIKKALLDKDSKTLGGFASNDAVDSDAIVKDAATHSFIHEVLKTYEYKHLIKEEIEGVSYLVFEAHMAIADNNGAVARVFKLYMSEKDGHLQIDFYVNVQA